ncbi:bromodomain protein-3- variant [Apiospora rasikravindrae]|uniref:Bromodomain protein-3- variant n=1 Tax=Apiospora rasikravindrae TaxID=990691 RepID=A0ABR1SZB1_9PEZI
MATEEPQTIIERKDAQPEPEGEKKTVEKAAEPTVNGHATSDETSKSEEPSTVNGKAGSPQPPVEENTVAKNQEAFAANASISAKESPKLTENEPTAESADKDMVDANDVQEDAAPAKSEARETEAPESPKVSPEPQLASAEKEDEKPAAETSADDSMEVDESSGQPDLSSSGEHGESTQATALSEPAVVSSPHEVSQPPEPSTAEDVKMEEAAPAENKSESGAVLKERSATPGKVAREREDDPAEERSAKRAKTESQPEAAAEDSIGVATGLSPAPTNPSDDLADSVPNDKPITFYQNKEIRAQIGRVKKTKSGSNFRSSVEKLWPQVWDSYKQQIENPVDLSMFEVKLRETKYETFGEFKADLQLLHDNALKFNGPGNIVTLAALQVRNDLLGRLVEIAKNEEPLRIDKGKHQPTRQTEPRAATQVRRQSQSTPRAPPATSPKAKTEPTTNVVSRPSPAPPTSASSSGPAFALPPNGMPQIRRDSTRGDGDRPKRPINPPKNRDPDYSSKPGLKKRLDPELKFYGECLMEVRKAKHWNHNQFFLEPVDPVAFNIPTYFSIIKKPMDLGTMSQKLERGEYRTGKEIEKDLRQMVANSEQFNGQDSLVTISGQALEAIFKDEVAKKDAWMAKNAPIRSRAGSAGTPELSAHDSDEESEAEAEEQENDSIRNLQSRLSEEQVKLNGLLGAKKPDLTMIEIQQNVVSMLQRKLVEEKTKFSGEPKKPKSKKKSISKSKPKSSSGGGAAAGNGVKKSSGSVPVLKKASGTNKKAASKKRHMGNLEKAVIAEGINELDGPLLNKAVDIIKKDTHQKEDDDGQLELDIESLSQEALSRLFDLITKSYPGIYQSVSSKPEFKQEAKQAEETRAKNSALPKPKKNKPMNKHEQERNIEKLRELKAQFQRQGSGSQEPMPGDEENRPGDSSDEEEESDSEEE